MSADAELVAMVCEARALLAECENIEECVRGFNECASKLGAAPIALDDEHSSKLGKVRANASRIIARWGHLAPE